MYCKQSYFEMGSKVKKFFIKSFQNQKVKKWSRGYQNDDDHCK